MGHVHIVVDLGFGDAGKGRVTDALVREQGARAVVRFNGGAQAGHNVLTDDGRHHCFSQFGAGSFVPGVDTFLSRFVVVHPTALLVEAEHLARVGVGDPLSRIVIDERALVTTPFQQAANRIREIARGAGRHGSCGIGFGETVADALDGFELRARDMRDRETLRRAGERIRDRKRAELAHACTTLRNDEAAQREIEVLGSRAVLEAWIDRTMAIARTIRIDDGSLLAATLNGPEPVVFEGAQGVLLDEGYGFHPHTTWSTCTFANALAVVHELAPSVPCTKIGVTRTYAVRHGAGPMPSAEPALDAALAEPHNVFGPWQGHVRRGWPDFVLLRYAVAACGGVDAVALTHLDALSQMADWHCVDRYASFGVERREVRDLPVITPPEKGWTPEVPTALMESMLTAKGLRSQLPTEERDVIARFSLECGAPVTMTSRRRSGLMERSS